MDASETGTRRFIFRKIEQRIHLYLQIADMITWDVGEKEI